MGCGTGRSRLRETSYPLRIALLAQPRLYAHLHLRVVLEDALDRRRKDRNAARALELRDEVEHVRLMQLALAIHLRAIICSITRTYTTIHTSNSHHHSHLCKEEDLRPPVLRVREIELLEHKQRLPRALVAQTTQAVAPVRRHLRAARIACARATARARGVGARGPARGAARRTLRYSTYL